MQVFEFHFNPQKRDDRQSDLIFDSFCYEPSNLYEKRVGSLYLVGLLKNALPQNTKFLDILAKTVKEKYYQLSAGSSEKSLKFSLKKTNEFLEKIARGGDVSWLGNLNLAIISLKDLELNFTKIGDLKILLLRNNQIIDIDKNLKLEDIEPYPLKIFGNIISGKLAEDDIILVLTKEVFDSFLEAQLLKDLAAIYPFEPKKLKQILDSKKDNLSDIKGICFLLALTKTVSTKQKGTFEKSRALKLFSFKKIVPQLKLPKIKLPKFSLKKLLRLWWTQIESKKLRFFSSFAFATRKLAKKRSLILISLLAIFLILGSFIFNKLEEKQSKIYQAQLNQIQIKVSQAENYLTVGKNNQKMLNRANVLLKESWNEISSLSNTASSFSSTLSTRIFNLKNTVSQDLSQINNLKVINDIQPIFEFKTKEFIPLRITAETKNLYLFSPYSENVFKIDEKNTGKILTISKNIQAANSLSDSVLLFSKPNFIISLKDESFGPTIALGTPYPNFNFNTFSSYQSGLYFLDSQKGAIVKYNYLGNSSWEAPYLWLSKEVKNATDFRSIAVDGSVWILTKNNAVQRYYAGRLQEDLNLDIFPEIKDITKIFTTSQLPYLYLLEPLQKRIIVLAKSGPTSSPQAGQILYQFFSSQFDNLLDFTVSTNGRTIYLLNGFKIYQISF